MLEKGLLLKATVPLVFFLWLVRSLKNLQIIGLLITERNAVFYSDFQHGFKSSSSTVDLLTVASDKSARAFNRSEAT